MQEQFFFLQLLVSVMKRDKLFPTTLPGVDVDIFVKVGSMSFADYSESVFVCRPSSTLTLLR